MGVLVIARTKNSTNSQPRLHSGTGTTAMTVAAARPAAPIIAVSPDAATCRQSTLLWGTVPVEVDPAALRDTHALARRVAVALGFAGEGQSILLIAGFVPDEAQSTPSITVLRI